MNNRMPDRRAELIDRLSALAAERLPREKAGPAIAFLRALYANVAIDDLADRRPDDLYGAALALWNFGRHREPGEAKVRIYAPRLAEHGWRSRHSIIEIVNDDMPFLVDSVTAELNRHALAVHLVIHPIVHVKRSASGEALDVVAAGEGTRESFMHVEVDEETDAPVLDAIRTGIAGVLRDVRVAVGDWRVMRDRAQAVIDDLFAHPPPVPEHEVHSARDFLSWLVADHFTFLGYRQYEYSGTGDDARANLVAGAGLGLLRDEAFLVFDGLRNLSTLPPEVQDFVRRPTLLKITKANRRSTVHRPSFLDTIGIKRFDEGGNVVGERLFMGLFTSVAYNQSPHDIPVLRDKVDRVMTRAGFAPDSHDGKALFHILEGFPRDELFQIGEDELHEIALGILQLQDRQRIALFARKDPFERFVSCLVYVPQDIYTTDLRLRFQAILEDAFAGRVTNFTTQVSQDSALARVHFIVAATPGQIPGYDVKEVTRRLTEASRTFRSMLQLALIEAMGEERGLAAARRYAEAFPAGYSERFTPETAAADIERIESVLSGATPLAMGLYRPVEAEANEINFKIFHPGKPVPLSDVLPMLEHMGLKVIAELPFQIEPAGAPDPVWMHDFSMELRDIREVELSAIKTLFESAFAHMWAGDMEDDGFNRLVLAARLDWREVSALRAYCKYLRQIGIPFSQAYMEETLTANPRIARRLVDLFVAKFDPAAQKGAEVRKAGLLVEIDHLLDEVANLDQDRILRRFLNLVRATLRTNYFQAGADGKPKPYLSLKLASGRIEELPLPRPLVEIFVASPRVEAIHLRGGKVARGGIRWSDRREDFRTEILGLMKAQMVKNAVIVPVGSKGGFVVKRPPVNASREALQAEVVACYKTLMRGMLDITDNRVGDGIAAPRDVVREDGDDPYLVVAADKGTATFSDIANSVSAEYGFWLGDAFASGGSAGYDHKAMGITARGAWESVKRHFRELGIDIQVTDFTVVGVGDMSGDVFGNGMLLSPHIKLIAAFDHRHVFIDPDPDPAVSLRERRRLFELPRSSWADYDPKLVSRGGGVFDRKAKSIRLPDQVRGRFGITAESVTPADLMRALLKAEVDLLWFGGIGTYVKSSRESNADADDRANDALRVDGRDLRARVVGEGANLGVTQRGRIEYARVGNGGRGGRINTDAIDNSAGVDTSDHEVNIKIALGDIVAQGDMTVKQRDQLLAEMTDDVARLVLRNNYLQTQALSIAEFEGPGALDRDVRLIHALEKSGRLNRAIEFLPDNDEIRRRHAAGEGLTRPERAVLLAYAKLWLYDELLDSDLPDDPYLADDLLHYFPRHLRKRFPEAIQRHRLRREIIATFATNSLVNRAGACFVNDMVAKTGLPPSQVTRAYTVVRQVFGLRPLWSEIEALDGRVGTEVQYRLLRAATRLVERATLRLLRQTTESIDIGATVNRYEPAATALKAVLTDVLDPERARLLAERTKALVAEGVSQELAAAVAGLGDLTATFDLAQIAARFQTGVEAAARVYFRLGAKLAIDWLRRAVEGVKADNDWQKLALAAVVGDLNALQAEAASTALAATNGDAGGAVEAWTNSRRHGLQRIDTLITDVKSGPSIDLAALTVVGRELRNVIAGPAQ